MAAKPTYNKVLSDLNEGRIAPLYFASGSDYFLYRQFVSEFRTAFTKRYGENANYVQRWGADLKVATDVSNLLGGGGLFSTASLIMLHEIQDAGTGVKTKLASLLGNLPQDTIVLVHYSVSDFRKSKWLGAIKSVATEVSLISPDSSALPGIVNQMAKQHQIQINESGVYRLIELSSGELAIIDNELEKLSLYLSDPDELVTRDIVDHVAGVIENAQVSQFIDAIYQRDRQLAIQTMVEIHHQGKEGLPFLVAMLYNGLIKLMALREPPEARKTISQGATSYYWLSQLNAFSRNYSMTELQDATRKLADLDLKFRLGSMDVLAAFTEWISEVV